MSSVRSYKAQPLTHSFVVTQGNSAGPYMFTQAGIDSWLAANSTVTSVGSLAIVPSSSFVDIVNGVSDPTPPLTGGIPSIGTYDYRKNLTDMGKEYVIGTDINSRMVVLRLVKLPAVSSVGALGGDVVYVVVENNCTDLAPNDNGRFSVRVARI